MADEWYCEIAGREIGPLSSEQLRAMAAKGQILSSDCVRQGAQGSWILARQVKGLLPPASELSGGASEKSMPLSKAPPLQRGGVSQEQESSEDRARPKALVFPAPGSDSLPVAQRLPQASAASPSPPVQMPVVPPRDCEKMGTGTSADAVLTRSARVGSEPVPVFSQPPPVADVFDPVALGIVTDPPAAKAGVQARTKTVLPRERRRLERQKMTVGLLLVAIVGLAIAGLLLAFGGGSSESGQSGSAMPAKKAHAAKAVVETPEALEAREGIESLDSPKPKPRKISVETPKTPVAADFDHAKTTEPRASKKAVPPKKPHEPKPGTPEGDFGLPEVDEESQ